jgi:hypothetical protein
MRFPSARDPLACSGLAIAFGAAMITLDQFLLANICFFVAAGIFTERAVRLDISRLARFWCVIVIWVLAAIVVLEVKYYGYEKTLAAAEGDLVPANEPTPKTNCGRMQKPNTYILLLGSIVVETDNLPNTVIERGDTKLLWIDKGTDGGISLNFRAYSVIAHPPAGRFTLTASPGHPPGPPAGPRARSGHATARWR